MILGMDGIRAWYGSDESEPLRREVGATLQWLLRGRGRIWLIGAVLIGLLPSGANPIAMRVMGLFQPWLSRSALADIYVILIGPLLSPIFMPLPMLIIWGGWLYVLYGAALRHLRPGWREQWAVTSLSMRQILPMLIAPPLLYLAIAYPLPGLAGLLRPLYTEPYGPAPEIHRPLQWLLYYVVQPMRWQLLAWIRVMIFALPLTVFCMRQMLIRLSLRRLLIAAAGFSYAWQMLGNLLMTAMSRANMSPTIWLIIGILFELLLAMLALWLMRRFLRDITSPEGEARYRTAQSD